ncbi:Rho-GTPase-activating protein 8 [Colletotrichum siamense]|uniref:Rho-GTPase-activating protein 8 n=1 Tax=Colletotrichum siamense TaxID=690259 RepID=UPI00187259AE|nr:Rho-GTPase-activating protein 8 [Colletotrichum siamense]KAF4837898.1 Rho-GTPase-activating protein 8 [Colletotrichum tropicale]KAI8154933.1 Rho-GTPase-activating protein 8 [Colletotrichum sp. SAR 10_71]KAI8161291.1 Rho-GTPase-activating protein 8 [Colletotrichum sp. SAR 10_70]KAI8166688.1 Rho-GTPase-activating protein 8 [Colletotrichum sp. SAR 10_65]KAI8186499.1 Rho-GTPase-activating protein 8 [Colletotrichum sp. SAR 10_75]KAI8197699.1 Rho-GTPase-activating protein 8 [Colletotrichum sp. S
MPGFAESFWSSDYAAGLGVLFSKLQQGVHENRQILTVARLRAEAEEIYSQRLGDIAPAADKVQGGFSRDDGASVRKAYDGVRTEMEEGAKNHKKIAQNIRDLVVNPFSRWCDAHESRIQDSQDELQARIKAHDRQAELVKKLRSTYFNKCRLVEDIEEETKLAFQDPETSPKNNIPEIKVSENKEPEKVEEKHEVDDEEEMVEIGDEFYNADQVKKMLEHMLNTIKLGETKVPILGVYQNTSSGADIVEYLQKHLNTSSVSYAERIGQDLITAGFLRLIGNVGSTFANSSKMFYQWRPKAFKAAGVPEKKLPLGRTFSLPASESSDSPVVGTVSEYLANWNVLNNAHPNETPAERLRREAREADDKYKGGVRKLDEMRCDLEETIFLHLRFLERCELDRLKAIKTVILDFSGTISNVIPSLQSAVDNMMLFQETVQPSGDLRYLLENYRTGSFIPKVVVYENYYNKVDEQTFGVDLEARARADKKRVPVIITTILTYLDNHYPDLEGDEARRGVWLVDVPLNQIHKLRAKINDGKPIPADVFDEFDIPTVASLLKLYLLELPDSLVSSHVYEIIRTIYQTQTQDNDAARVPVLQQTLSQLRLTNIATLDACMNHFTRLIDLTSADEAYISTLATALAPCILRPRTETSLTMEEKHAYRLIRDLFAHKDAIFSELKRMSTLNHSGSVNNRPRAISTDESNRRANMEERNRALLEKAAGSRGRATSPAPSPRGHRRDRSVGGPETRFPIQTSPPASAVDRHRSSLGSVIGAKRSSLEVPGSDNSSPAEPANGTANPAPAAEGVAARIQALESPVEKRNSLGRSTARYSLERRVPVASSGNDSAPSTPRGVTLEDKPMDD